jgi:hypothetical protein
MSNIVLNRIKQWRRPHKYRSIIAYNPKGIYQIDMMHLYPLWSKMFNKVSRQDYGLNNYAIVCVDVYSRYVKCRSIPNKQRPVIAGAIYELIVIMGKPNTISADNEIIDSLYLNNQLYVEFDGIQLYRTSPHELNKNAIVERMIRTLKQYLLNILITYKLDNLKIGFRNYKEQFVKIYNMKITFVDYLLEICCEINNNNKHRMIKAVPKDVFNMLEHNKQKINRVHYDLYKIGTIVIKKSETKGAFSNKVFNFDPELYVIGQVDGRKYRLYNLLDLLEGKRELTAKRYQPYEIRAFSSIDELMSYLTSDLIKNSLIELYTDQKKKIDGRDKYNLIIEWINKYK